MSLQPGFADPVADAQACFRAVLAAMARPGRVHRVRGPQPPAPLGPAAAAVLLTLADADTPLWLDPAAAGAWPWVAFHTGAPAAPAPDAAVFVHALALPDLDALRAGSDEAPEASATLVLEVAELGHGAPLRLGGPGIDGEATLPVQGLASGFAAAWAANRARFPRGIDLILTAGDTLAALPRGLDVAG